MLSQDLLDKAWKVIVKKPNNEGYEKKGQLRGLVAYLKDYLFLEDEEAEELEKKFAAKQFGDISEEVENVIQADAALWTKIAKVQTLNNDLNGWVAFLVPQSEKEVLGTIQSQALQVDITVCEAASCAGFGVIYININDVRMEGDKPVTFSVCHEFGHIVDGALTKDHLDYLQTIIPGYKGNEVSSPHDKEFFGDAFATRLLKASGWDPEDIRSAAKTLLGGTSASITHPSGADRIKQIDGILQTKA
jgi:hypothetical protein